MTRNFVGLLALLLSLVACGDEGGSADSVDEPATSSATSPKPSTPGPELTADETKAVGGLQQALLNSGYKRDPSIATCLATGYVDSLGITWLQAHGMLRDDLSGKRAYFTGVLSEGDADTFYDVQLWCVDFKRLVASMVADPPDMKDPYVIHCVNAVTEADVHEAFAAAASNQDFHSTPFAKKLEAAGCGYEGD